MGPVGERPVHVCLLRAEEFETPLRAGLLSGVRRAFAAAADRLPRARARAVARRRTGFRARLSDTRARTARRRAAGGSEGRPGVAVTKSPWQRL